jgi:putative peptidoglycan lipid II flippase
MSEDLKKSIAQSTLAVILLNLLGYVIGFVTQVFVARSVGVGSEMDAFVAVSIIPEFMYGITNAVLLTGFVILFYEYAASRSEIESQALVARIFSFSFVVLSTLALILIVFSKPVIHSISPGFTGEQLDLASNLLKVFSVSIVLFGLSSFMVGILTIRKKFSATKAVRIFIGIGIIFGVIFFEEKYGVISLVFGTLLGLIVAYLTQYYYIKKENFSFYFDFHGGFLKKLILISAPVILGSLTYYMTKTVINVVASLQGDGFISSFNYAFLLVNVPIIFFCQAISTVIFPYLTEKDTIKNKEIITSLMSRSMGIIMTIMVPLTIVYLLLGSNIISLVFERGEFTKEATQIVGQSLFYLAIGMVPMGIYSLMTSFFYSTKKFREQVLLHVGSLLSSVVCILVGVHYFSYKGIGLGLSVSFWIINLSVWYYLFKKEYIKYSLLSLLKVLISSCAVAIFIVLWKNMFTFSNILTLLCFVCSFVVYVFFMYMQKSEDLTKIYSLLKAIIKNKNPDSENSP